MFYRIAYIYIVVLIVSEFISSTTTVDLEKTFREKNRRIKLNVNQYFDSLQPAIGPFLKNSGFDPIELPRLEEKLAGEMFYSVYTGKLILKNGTLSDFSDIKRHGDSFLLYDNATIEARGGIIIRTVNFRYDYVADLVAVQYCGRVVGQANHIAVAGSLIVDLDSYDLRLDRLEIATKGKLFVTFEGNALIDWMWNAITRIVTDTFKQQLSQVITMKAREYVSRVLQQMKNKEQDNQVKDVVNLVMMTVG